ncbi:MAG: hypothetical protein BGO26_13355 [Actinobacteria bacterium 69-20]|nr:MAG: hypothetical protein BGO26_13355 [Actinobacteria bacterium 69-20]
MDHDLECAGRQIVAHSHATAQDGDHHLRGGDPDLRRGFFDQIGDCPIRSRHPHRPAPDDAAGGGSGRT